MLASVGLDLYGVAGIVQAMARRDMSGDDRLVGVSQGFKLTGTIKMAEVKLADGEMLHCGSKRDGRAGRERHHRDQTSLGHQTLFNAFALMSPIP